MVTATRPYQKGDTVTFKYDKETFIGVILEKNLANERFTIKSGNDVYYVADDDIISLETPRPR